MTADEDSRGVQEQSAQKLGYGSEVALGKIPVLPPGLYLVATPIGNLGDITLRGLRTLQAVDRIACEDTRQTAKLLSHFGIRKPTVSLHLHNEQGRGEELLRELQAGARLAIVTDAGTPAIADPGEALVRAAAAHGIPVFPIPGANAALCALVASGLAAETFTFRGFLPAKSGQRRSFLESVRAMRLAAGGNDLPAPTEILYETPHRILEALEDVQAVFGQGQVIVLARELTKLHEEFLRGTVAEVLTTLRARDTIRGEMVLLLSGEPAAEQGEGSPEGALSLTAEVEATMRHGLSEKDALKQVAKTRGLGKSEVYREWQRRKR